VCVCVSVLLGLENVPSISFTLHLVFPYVIIFFLKKGNDDEVSVCVWSKGFANEMTCEGTMVYDELSHVVYNCVVWCCGISISFQGIANSVV
jgi:hypothetical protein